MTISVHHLGALGTLESVVEVGGRHGLPVTVETFSYVLTLRILLLVLAFLDILRLEFQTRRNTSAIYLI